MEHFAGRHDVASCLHIDKAEGVFTARRVDRSLSGNFSLMLFIRSAASFRALVSMAAIATCSMMSHTASDGINESQGLSSCWKAIPSDNESCLTLSDMLWSERQMFYRKVSAGLASNPHSSVCNLLLWCFSNLAPRRATFSESLALSSRTCRR